MTNKEEIVTLIFTIITAVSLASEKIRNFIMGWVFLKNKNTKDSEENIDRLMERVNKLTEDFILLNQKNIETNTEIFRLQNENLDLKKKILKNCDKNCANV